MRTFYASAVVVCLFAIAKSATADWVMPRDATWELISQPNSVQAASGTSQLEGRPTAGGAATDSSKTASVVTGKDAVVFSVDGDSPSLRTATWKLKIEGSQQPVQYVSFRYRSFGVDRGYTPVNVIMLDGVDASGGKIALPLVPDKQIINDRQWHVLTAKLKDPVTPSQITLQLGTTDSTLEFAIGHLSLNAGPAVLEFGFERANNWDGIKLSKQDFHSIDLAGRFNKSADAHFGQLLENSQMLCDAGNSFRDTYASVAGIPFHLGEQDRNLIWPDETRINAGKIPFFGELVDRGSLIPEMRDDTTAIEVGRKASELYLLLVNNFPVSTGRYGLPDAPYEITDVDAFRIELIYDDGQRDIVFPYSIADGGFILRRMCGAYVIPCDATRTLQRAVIHNCITGKTVGLMAATVNIGTSRLFPQTVVDESPTLIPALAAPAAVEPSVMYSDKILVVKNRFYDVSIDCSNGLSIKKLTHRSSPNTQIAISPDSVIEVRIGDRVFGGGSFETKDVKVNGKTAIIRLISREKDLPLSVDVRVDASDPQQLIFGATLINTSDKLLQPTVTFPKLNGLSLGDKKSNWLYFPQYRVVLTDQPCFFRAPNDRSFAVQFFDFFNPSVGIGLAMITHNHEGLPLDYMAAKNEQGLSGGIIYPEPFAPIEAGASRRLPDTALAFHNGDWHEAFALYMEWFKRTIPSVDSSARDWFKNVWLFKSEVVSDPEARGINRTPGILDRKAGRYRIDESFDMNERYYGMLPQAFHFYNWFYDEKLKEEVWGDYSTDSYNNAGGLELMRSTIKDLQEHRKIPASLYLIPDRCSKSSEFGKKHGDKIAGRTADGAISQDEKAFYVCPSLPLWRDHFIDTAVRVQRETGAKILYIDVFAFYRGHACFAKDHGHPVPSIISKASTDLLQKLREKLPADVVLYSEYPCTDVSSNWNDGNLEYYNLSLEEHFVRSHDIGDIALMCGKPVQSIDRFAFPSLRHFSWVVGIDGDDNKGTRFKPIFFNGEGMLDATWRLYPGPHAEFVRQTLKLRVKYTDCFSTLVPQPLVPTLRAGVYANRFPGKNRDLYTIYNARFTPVRGEVLSIECQPGDTFYDAINGHELLPTIGDGKAVISLELQPQAVGCIIIKSEPNS